MGTYHFAVDRWLCSWDFVGTGSGGHKVVSSRYFGFGSIVVVSILVSQQWYGGLLEFGFRRG